MTSRKERTGKMLSARASGSSGVLAERGVTVAIVRIPGVRPFTVRRAATPEPRVHKELIIIRAVVGGWMGEWVGEVLLLQRPILGAERENEENSSQQRSSLLPSSLTHARPSDANPDLRTLDQRVVNRQRELL